MAALQHEVSLRFSVRGVGILPAGYLLVLFRVG
jgi:hypothetical protein